MRLATILSLAAILYLPAPSPAGDVPSRDRDGAAISGASPGLPFEPTLDAIQANVFTPSCALGFCHGAAMQMGLDLREGASFGSLVGVPSNEVPSVSRVEPFDPDNSYIICKLENCPWIVGSQMPLIGGPLDPAFIDVIRTWILLGAPEFPPVSVEDRSWGRIKSAYH